MPRKMRVEYPGAMYHVMSRGDQRDDIFFDDADRYDFIKTLGEAGLKTAQAKPDRLVAEERLPLGWSAEDLVRRPKKDPGKLALAVRLRRETTLTIKDITARVHLGTYNTANARLRRVMKEGFASCNRAETTMRK